ncbi:unnamed protein product [Allacma fusca]|uniref:Uncharacterized protein n=1 Tax=Allacma fusca TaxID=39272 RepID=A0A8J2KK09_9HEXA|nr:unnamed protein product [Allacma fusca]
MNPVSFCSAVLLALIYCHGTFGFETVEFDNSSLPVSTTSENIFQGIVEQESSLQDIDVSKSRSKRFITFNVLAPIDIGLLLAIPITLILPSMTNLFTKRVKKSIPADMDPEVYEDDPIVQNHLDRVSNYFDLLQIPEKACQQRAVCEFSASPEKYYPISEMVLQRIRNPELPVVSYEDDVPAVSRKPKSLFKVYNKAADHGMNYGENSCHQEFLKKCPYSIEKRLNMPVLRFWKALSTLLKFSIKDNTM